MAPKTGKSGTTRKITALLAATVATSGIAVAVTLSAEAAPAPAGAAAAADSMQSAMRRDLGLSAEGATTRLADEDRAARADRGLRKQLAAKLGGSWYDAGRGKLVVAVTDNAAAATARSAGADAVLVSRTEAQLDELKARLDANQARSPKTVPAWYVDLPGNKIVVKSRGSAIAAARAFVAASGVPADAVSVEASDESPRKLIDVVGGNAYYIGSGTRCSVGFSVTGGFVTAGHCGSTGASTTQPSGSFAGSSFPGNDYAFVRVGAGNTVIGAVNNYSGGRVAVAGSTDAPVGSSICRSGSTTGWRCGTIQARNSSVTYPEGTITGLIRTNACAEPGDSGGSAISGSQAQGVTSGGSGNCSSGGTTYFQPVNEILQAYGLSLVTNGGTPPTTTPPTTNPPGTCTGTTYTGSLASGGRAVQPNNSYYQTTVTGAHRGCLTGPAGTDFDLYLQKWNGSTWANVGTGGTPSNVESVSYTGTAGYYRWQVHAYSGSGSYTLRASRP
ncbi:S1 family peptidase [Actinokineospora terrae]|uniref:Streptogrisin C n=1 Tax=Actinokineospora terrae TaxID=155974 RepID=A0A1H9KZN0_9PSEU|nr:S1 family peptidase [Actinokineospora terrae]SER04375.1 streptogrisin C [Actinokineospora terrae]